jgi:hypothetical protein
MSLEQSIKGPAGYENWKRSLADGQLHSEFEFQCYSDAHIVAEVTSGCGPYKFFNTVPAVDIGSYAHVATVRVGSFGEPSTPDLSRTDTSRYHGGWLADELCALCSLAMGIRFKSGGVSRDFWNGDAQGSPRADTEAPPSPLPRRQRPWVVPIARGSHNIADALVPRLSSYPRLGPLEAIALVRSARLYQDAIWIAESEPELAWLLLVSAVEVVATHHQLETSSPTDLVRISLPALRDDLLEAGGEALLARCAEHLSRHLRATNRFLSFLREFMPPEPSRPQEKVAAVSWNPGDMRAALSMIYGYRSLALHDGTPFPRPMCDPPSFGDWYNERPSCLAAGYADGAWSAEDMPMLLHLFEYIARGALLKWWDERAENAITQANETAT